MRNSPEIIKTKKRNSVGSPQSEYVPVQDGPEMKINTRVNLLERAANDNDDESFIAYDEDEFYDAINGLETPIPNVSPYSYPQQLFLEQQTRTCLPAVRPIGFKLSLWQIIKDFIGKDITKITFTGREPQ